MSEGSGTLRLPVEFTTGAVTKTLGLTCSVGALALGAVEAEAIVEFGDEVKEEEFFCEDNKLVWKQGSLKASWRKKSHNGIFTAIYSSGKNPQ